MNIVLSSAARALVLAAMLSLGSAATEAACLDMKQDFPRTFEGTPSFRVLPGPPNHEGVNKGDTPEPSYALKLDKLVCVDGNDFSDPIDKAGANRGTAILLLASALLYRGFLPPALPAMSP